MIRHLMLSTAATLVIWPLAGLAAQPKLDLVGGGAASARLPVPREDVVAEALPIIREAFAPQLAAARGNPAKVPALVEALVAAADQTTVPERRYALLQEAEVAAADGGAPAELMRIVDLRCAWFAIRPEEAFPEACEGFVKKHDDDPKRLEALVVALLDRAMQTFEGATPEATEALLAMATKANSALGGACRRKKLPPTTVKALAAEIGSRRKEIAERRQRQVSLDAARIALERNPDDPAANTTLGIQRCFVAGDWEAGLPMLAKGEAADLRAAARAELALEPEGPPGAVFEVANTWWAMAERLEGSKAEGAAGRASTIKDHAAMFYRLLAGKLPDPIDATLAERRAKGLPQPGGGRPQGSEIRPPRSQLPEAFGRRGDPATWAGSEGGDAETEAAVDRGLRWLAEHQLADGGWSFDLAACPACRGRCSHSGSRRDDRGGATAMALLPFLGRGFTHRDGPYKDQVERGIGFLVRLAVAGDGKAYDTGGNLYSQGIAGIALAECYAMTKDARLAAPTQAVINYIVQAQDPKGGGWRYSPRQPGDTSAFGWQFTALHTGSLASLRIDPAVMRRAVGFLDFAQADGGAAYGYLDGSSPSPTRSAIGLWCRLKSGWRADQPAMQRGADAIAVAGPTKDLYFNYYASRLLHGLGGDRWRTWNERMKPLLLNAQSDRDHEQGSWYEGLDGGHGAHAAGRVYCTVLATLILEEYYR